MIKSIDEIINGVTSALGDNTDDNTLGLLEDITDTFGSLQPNGEDWESKYKENDTMWREKYRDRFMGKGVDPEPQPEPTPTKRTFEDLFE